MRNILPKSKAPYVLILLITAGFFIVIFALYNLIYISPIIKSRKSLTESKNLTSELKLANSKNTIAYNELSSLNPSHPTYQALVDESLKAFDESQNEIADITKRRDKLPSGGTKEVRSYLNGEYKNKINGIINTFSANINNKKSNIENFKRDMNILGNIVGYNPYIDLGSLNLDSDKDREIAIGRSEAAITGMEKAVSQVNTLNFSKKVDLDNSLKGSINSLKAFTEAIKTNDMERANIERNAFLNSFKTVFDLSSEALRQSSRNEDLTKQISGDDNLNSQIDAIIAKIEDLQRNLPLDPLSSWRQKK